MSTVEWRAAPFCASCDELLRLRDRKSAQTRVPSAGLVWRVSRMGIRHAGGRCRSPAHHYSANGHLAAAGLLPGTRRSPSRLVARSSAHDPERNLGRQRAKCRPGGRRLAIRCVVPGSRCASRPWAPRWRHRCVRGACRAYSARASRIAPSPGEETMLLSAHSPQEKRGAGRLRFPFSRFGCLAAEDIRPRYATIRTSRTTHS